jgi:DNA-binding MarR family transcriptional regulator
MNERKEDLMERFFRIGMLLHRYHHQNFGRFAPFKNPHRGQGRVLSILKMQPEISQKELSYLLDMRNQSLGELLAKLERGGFIERTPSEKDRRVMNVKLTPEGAKAAEQTEEKVSGGDKLFDCFSDEEQNSVIALLDRLIEELESSMGTDDMPHRGDRRPPFDMGRMSAMFGLGRGQPPFDRERGTPPFGDHDRPHCGRSHRHKDGDHNTNEGGKS